MKVILVISGLMYGGGQKVVLDLLRHFRHRNELDAQLIVLGCNDTALQQAAAHVVAYDGRYNRLTTLLPTAWRLRTQLNDREPAVLHTHGWDADIIGWLAILGRRTRQIIHLHITPEWLASRDLTHRVRRFLTRRAFARRGTVLIAVSNAVRDHWGRLLPWNAGEVVTIHNGIDAALYAGSGRKDGHSDNGPTIGVVARLAPMKGIEYLLDAVAELVAEHPKILTRIAGEGSLKEKLRNKASELGIAQNVEFIGHVEDVRSFYRSIDIFVLPSIHTEGLPLVLLEAMAAALPIVATTVGGAPEAIRDGQDGFLVPRGDTTALARAIGRLLADESLCQRLGDSAQRRVVAKFSMAICSHAVFDLYREPMLESGT